MLHGRRSEDAVNLSHLSLSPWGSLHLVSEPSCLTRMVTQLQKQVQMTEAQSRAHWLGRVTITGTGSKTVFMSLLVKLRYGANGAGEK